MSLFCDGMSKHWQHLLVNELALRRTMPYGCCEIVHQFRSNANDGFQNDGFKNGDTAWTCHSARITIFEMPETHFFRHSFLLPCWKMKGDVSVFAELGRNKPPSKRTHTHPKEKWDLLRTTWVLLCLNFHLFKVALGVLPAKTSKLISFCNATLIIGSWFSVHWVPFDCCLTFATQNCTNARTQCLSSHVRSVFMSGENQWTTNNVLWNEMWQHPSLISSLSHHVLCRETATHGFPTKLLLACHVLHRQHKFQWLAIFINSKTAILEFKLLDIRRAKHSALFLAWQHCRHCCDDDGRKWMNEQSARGVTHSACGMMIKNWKIIRQTNDANTEHISSHDE